MTERQRWAEERLVSYLLDALPEDQSREVEEILGGVDEYQEILEGRSPEDIGHIPAALLARWNRAGLMLEGVERVLVIQHLESCGDCREELELVGGSVHQWADAPESEPREPMGRRPEGHRATVVNQPSWLGWLGGAAMGIAAGILLMIFLPEGDPDPAGLHGTALPVVVPQNMRSDTGEATVVQGSHSPLLLALVLPRMESAGSGELVVIGPEGIELSRTTLQLGPGAARTAQIVLQPDSGWASGEYTIELAVSGEASARELGSFELELVEIR